MNNALFIYNTLTKEKTLFEPINHPYVGMYVCGPTVYGDAHLGNARPAVVFDVVYRYLKYLGYKVRYVRNITDVGHLENDSDDGEDKVGKKAKLEKLEPMEVVQLYTDAYHQVMQKLNVLMPSIEPHASAHITEQIQMIEEIIRNGYAYESNGSVYFDVKKYSEHHPYGELSGRIPEELYSGTRELDGQHEKKNSADFALWKKASPEHIMRWPSPWSMGFPGWHLECSAMSAKYLGNTFDIHGGGMDLMFPHHESEIAQSKACHGHAPAKYWMHNNMITINGQKMAKSLGNFITLHQLFTGNNSLLDRAYSPMTVRFFMLQAHYRGTLDFSNDALLSAQKAYKRLMNGLKIIKSLTYPENHIPKDDKLNDEIRNSINDCFNSLNDDFNTAACIAALFNLLKKINAIHSSQIRIESIDPAVFEQMKKSFIDIIENILGLYEEKNTRTEVFINALLDLYREAKILKQYDKVDKIRAIFKAEGLVIKDMKNGIDWAYDEN
ncbi:MAG: cysteine--tRNA ligase [Cytophagaceae bacterium]|nr:cysteine--tRNA ligase [Cytophagaceae bacterium]MDW8456331.1 cysteine--tRNA ligase [Cytophagaceae bacterium]